MYTLCSPAIVVKHIFFHDHILIYKKNNTQDTLKSSLIECQVVFLYFWHHFLCNLYEKIRVTPIRQVISFLSLILTNEFKSYIFTKIEIKVPI